MGHRIETETDFEQGIIKVENKTPWELVFYLFIKLFEIYFVPEITLP